MSWGQHRRRSPGTGWFRFVVVWGISRGAVYWYFRLLHGMRRTGLDRIPRTGPIVYVANHVSHYDPPLVGCAVDDRPPAFLARDSLFRFRPFGALIRYYNSIPVVRGGRGAEAMKAAIAELEAGRAVLIFPEGTRSPDGALGRFKAGFLLLVRRTGATVVPVAAGGTFEAFSRHHRVPRLFRRVRVHVGEPIPADELTALENDAALARVRAGLVATQQELADQVA